MLLTVVLRFITMDSTTPINCQVGSTCSAPAFHDGILTEHDLKAAFTITLVSAGTCVLRCGGDLMAPYRWFV
jgi:hypothetical protein